MLRVSSVANANIVLGVRFFSSGFLDFSAVFSDLRANADTVHVSAQIPDRILIPDRRPVGSVEHKNCVNQRTVSLPTSGWSGIEMRSGL